MQDETVVIVGGGLAAQRFTETLRAGGFGGPVRMVSEEAIRPYDRPPLSKEVLAGKVEADSIHLRPESWYVDADIELLLGRHAERLDLERRTVVHFALAGEYLEEAPYVGVLFIAGAVGAIYVAIRLWTSRDVVAWGLGALIAAGMFVGFILSRTVGLPSFHEAEWEPSGIVSLTLEGLYLAGMGWWLRAHPRRARAADDAVPRRVGEVLTGWGRE